MPKIKCKNKYYIYNERNKERNKERILIRGLSSAQIRYIVRPQPKLIG